MDDGTGGQRPARGRPGSGAGPRGRPALAPFARIRAGRARPAALALALAGTALLGTACGGGAKPVLGALTDYQKALAYSQCMRAHGEPGFPDPQANGSLLIDGRKDHLNGALMNKASKACQHLMPKSPPLTASQQQRLLAQALKFIACMRAHGLPTMADPTVNSQGISMQIPRSVTPSSALFRNAQQACRHLAPGGLP